jgi:poly(3-hydroxybutyrate) depolymerase
MTMNHAIRTGLTLVLAAAALLAAIAADASVTEKSMMVAGVDVQYKVVLPDGYDPAKSYAAILAFGGGPQTMNTVDGILGRNLQAEAERRGYIVVAPAAPNGMLFFQGGERIFPAFLDEILQDYNIVDGKFHIAGVSNGGIAAFHVAAANPDYFLSVTAFPGYLWQPSDEKLLAMSKMCVYMYVGENDEYRWHDEMKREAEFLSAHGAIAKYSVETGEPHRIETLAGDKASRLFDDFDATKQGCTR